LGDADVGVGQHRLGGRDVVVGEFWRTASRPACAPSSGKTRLGTLADQAALEFRRRSEHMKNQPNLVVVVTRASVKLRNPMPLNRKLSTVSINCFNDRAKRSSFHTMSVIAAAREFERVMPSWAVCDRT
jgi:hypothetical protein